MEIPRDRLTIRFSRSGGPGGQHVNKVETKVEIRFRLADADWLSPRVRSRLAEISPRRVNRDGDFVVVSSRYRSRERNLEDCVEKLRDLIHRASQRRRPRVPTRPTAASRKKRVRDKQKRAARKKERSWKGEDDG